MLTSDTYDFAVSQKEPAPDHAVWGDVRQSTGTSFLARGLRLAALALFVACSLAMAASKLSNDLQLSSNRTVDVIVQFTRVPTDADLQPFAANQIVRRFRHLKVVHLALSAPMSPGNPGGMAQASA